MTSTEAAQIPTLSTPPEALTPPPAEAAAPVEAPKTPEQLTKEVAQLRTEMNFLNSRMLKSAQEAVANHTATLDQRADLAVLGTEAEAMTVIQTLAKELADLQTKVKNGEDKPGDMDQLTSRVSTLVEIQQRTDGRRGVHKLPQREAAPVKPTQAELTAMAMQGIDLDQPLSNDPEKVAAAFVSIVEGDKEAAQKLYELLIDLAQLQNSEEDAEAAKGAQAKEELKKVHDKLRQSKMSPTRWRVGGLIYATRRWFGKRPPLFNPPEETYRINVTNSSRPPVDAAPVMPPAVPTVDISAAGTSTANPPVDAAATNGTSAADTVTTSHQPDAVPSPVPDWARQTVVSTDTVSLNVDQARADAEAEAKRVQGELVKLIKDIYQQDADTQSQTIELQKTNIEQFERLEKWDIDNHPNKKEFSGQLLDLALPTILLIASASNSTPDLRLRAVTFLTKLKLARG